MWKCCEGRRGNRLLWGGLQEMMLSEREENAVGQLCVEWGGQL